MAVASAEAGLDYDEIKEVAPSIEDVFVSMLGPVQYATFLNPMRWFLEILRGIVMKGVGNDPEPTLSLSEAVETITQKNASVKEADELKQARESWRITTLQYQNQVTTSTEVLDSRAFLSEAESNYYRAIYGYRIAIAKLESAAGRK